jgi:hypothetical protein
VSGVKLILSESGYHDFILGLLIADDEKFDGKYCDKIYRAAIKRGLQSHIADFGCDEDLPELNALDNAGGTTAASTTTKSSENGSGTIFGCGVVGQSPVAGYGLLLSGLLIPLFARRKNRQFSKQKK